MEDKIFLLVRCTIKTSHKYIHEAIQEFQDGTQLRLSDTKNVKVLNTQIMKMNTRSSKN